MKKAEAAKAAAKKAEPAQAGIGSGAGRSGGRQPGHTDGPGASNSGAQQRIKDAKQKKDASKAATKKAIQAQAEKAWKALDKDVRKLLGDKDKWIKDWIRKNGGG